MNTDIAWFSALFMARRVLDAWVNYMNARDQVLSKSVRVFIWVALYSGCAWFLLQVIINTWFTLLLFIFIPLVLPHLFMANIAILTSLPPASSLIMPREQDDDSKHKDKDPKNDKKKRKKKLG